MELLTKQWFVHVLLVVALGFLVISDTVAKRSGRVGSSQVNKKPSLTNNGADRESKLLPFLAYVTFGQDMCKGDTGESGVCMKRSQCTTLGGKDSGTCAMGFGTCCAITNACSSETSVVKTNGTKLTPGANFQELCRYEIPKQPGVCQVRLDFDEFVIDEGPTAQLFGTCSSDTLTISGNSNAMLGPLCGSLEGQHMYLDYSSNDKINLDIYMVADMGQKWNIMVTMIKCDSLDRAPHGCLQYYTGQRGMVKSFNYNFQHQLNDEDYSVCVRPNPGMKTITWKSCGGVYDFFISGPQIAFPPVGQPGNPIGNQWSGSECTTDWVMIFGDNKYCGSVFPDTSVSMTQPFMMQVHFDHWELPIPQDLQPPDDSNTGFCLMYAQSPY